MIHDLPYLSAQLAVLGWIPLAIMAASAIAGAISKNKAKNREAQNNAAMLGDQTKNDQYRTQQNALIQALLGQSNEQVNLGNLDLKQKEFGVEANGTRGTQALLGSLLENIQPARLTGLSPQLQARMPRISGGLSPTAISPQARAAGGQMQTNALQGLRGGDTSFAPLQRTNFLSGVMTPPPISDYKGPSGWESILGLIGAAGSAYSAYGGGGGGNLGTTGYTPPMSGYANVINPVRP